MIVLAPIETPSSTLAPIPMPNRYVAGDSTAGVAGCKVMHDGMMPHRGVSVDRHKMTNTALGSYRHVAIDEAPLAHLRGSRNTGRTVHQGYVLAYSTLLK